MEIEGVGPALIGSTEGSGLRVAIACGRFNGAVTERLLKGAIRTLLRCGVAREALSVLWVPGAFELPLAAQRLATSHRFDAVICLGAVIRGETGHYDFVASECAAGLQRVQLDTGVPVVFGVLTTDSADQAFARAGGSVGDKGEEAALTAVEMVDLLARMPAAQ
ncbi:MAG: 6,7-dimethyl-8-ribityllumazine synthase [Actinobacteria bacterium]|nr:6,7-dimethyl-8-ribityllumazine synthase [Actinomycetota bacterium]